LRPKTSRRSSTSWEVRPRSEEVYERKMRKISQDERKRKTIVERTLQATYEAA
jgi:hypothetical protein